VKKLCWTKATEERVGQQLRSHSFMLHLRLYRTACVWGPWGGFGLEI
jgi:hypothetical protein